MNEPFFYQEKDCGNRNFCQIEVTELRVRGMLMMLQSWSGFLDRGEVNFSEGIRTLEDTMGRLLSYKTPS